jgi:hypothetical protein
MGCCGSAPKQPDYAASERAGVLAKANALPTQKLIENAATTGGKVTVGGKTYDFTGLGEAEIQAKYADAMAQAALDIQREQGPAYIEQRNKELQLADPEGYAMRKKQFDSIMAQLGQTPGTQDSIALQDSVLKDLEKGGQLDPEVERQARQQVLGQQVKRGNMRGQAAASQEAQSMTALSDSVKADRRSRAMQFLQSGATPEDITFRKNLQDMGNLGTFINSETPTAQFGQLSSGGAAPVNRTAPGVGMDYTAGSGAGWANANAGAQQDWQSNQANPWLAGMSMMFQGAGAYQSLKK